MSISAALSNALSGLTAASRSAQVVGDNVANAMTEGFGRRELMLSAKVIGGEGAGVRIDGVRRVVDEGLIRDRRLAGASLAEAEVGGEYADKILRAIGTPDQESSLSGRGAAFEAALIAAAARPDSQSRLAAVLDAAKSLANSLNQTSAAFDDLRVDADATIARDVTKLNESLDLVEKLNGEILATRSSGQSTAGLEDRRQLLIDGISEIVPLRQIQRDNGTIALYSMTGATLLDPQAGRFEFSATEPILPDMTLASGALSGLTLNGRPVETAGDTSPIAGGRLAALFKARDDTVPAAQANLDTIAVDLLSRFEDPALDATRLATDPGLFTDGGDLLDLADTVGLAGRISVNALVDLGNGGALYRLRDGLGATAPGPVGEASLLVALKDALDVRQAPTGGDFTGATRSFSGFLANLSGIAGQATASNSERAAFSRVRFDTLREAELSKGVDTDQEMQKLLLIEQAYAANAKVIQTVDEMIDLLTRL